jgi:N-acetyl-anhydromuramyl-L-alanine amidase AmpD
MVVANRELSDIKEIIIHCSATDNPDLDNVEAIRKMHLDKGWSDIGYHIFIDKRGRVFNGRPLDKVGAHCQGHNKNSIGICVSGNKKFTEEQFVALWGVVKRFMDRYRILGKNVLPHNYYNIYKTCPNFDLIKMWKYDENTQLWYAAKEKYNTEEYR